MQTRRSKLFLAAALTAPLALTNSCGGLSTLVGKSDKDNADFVVSSALHSIDQALEFLEAAPADSKICTGGLAATACVAGGKSLSFNGCTSSSGALSFSGSMALQFSDNSTCPTPLTNGFTSTLTTSDLKVTNSIEGTTLEISTASHSNYLARSLSGGLEAAMGSGSIALSIHSLSRHKTTTAGSLIYDHSVHSDVGLTILGDRASGTRSATGSLYVDHNGDSFTAKITLTNLRWTDPTCCLPTEGSVDVVNSGSKTGTSTITFSGSCGRAKKSDGNTSTDFTFESCS